MKFSILSLTMLFSFNVFAMTDETARLADAVETNNIRKARAAIAAGADVNFQSTTSTIFLRAVKLNRLEMVKLLLDNKANINQVKPVDRFSGLMIAAKHNNLEVAKLLISRGIDVTLTTVIGRNALHIAALSDSIDVAKVLVNETNIDVNAREGICALAVAARQDHREIVSFLKNQVGEKSPSEKCLRKAVEMAEFNGHTEVLRILNQ